MHIILYVSGIIVGHNCVQLSDAALDDLFLSKICFMKSSVKCALL